MTNHIYKATKKDPKFVKNSQTFVLNDEFMSKMTLDLAKVGSKLFKNSPQCLQISSQIYSTVVQKYSKLSKI